MLIKIDISDNQSCHFRTVCNSKHASKSNVWHNNDCNYRLAVKVEHSFALVLHNERTVSVTDMYD